MSLALDRYADLAETHISVVFFAGDRAFKLLKPVAMPFLDYSTTQHRASAVARELELNRRLSPDVYLGTADVMEDNTLVDRMLVMRRMPSNRRLPVVLGEADAEDQLRSIARRIAQFHSVQPPLHDVESIASRDAIAQNWRDNSAVIRPLVGTIFDEHRVSEVDCSYERYLAGRDHLFKQRIASGLVRDGHGDLTAEDIFCLEDGPRILDCIAFTDDLRLSDVLCDIAFLVMDVERLSGEKQADDLMRFYCEFSNEHHPDSLGHFYIAYRAHVRAKVAALRFQQATTTEESDASAALARQYHDLCLEHLRHAELHVVLVGGGPGTGKTTLATGLSNDLGWVCLNSDELRKDLTGHGHQDRTSAPFGQGIYTEEVTAITYQTLIDRSRLLLERGESVILDATWSNERDRQRIREVAESSGASFTEFECVLDTATAAQRVAERALGERTDASDATPEIVALAHADRPDWATATPIDTSVSPANARQSALAALQPRDS